MRDDINFLPDEVFNVPKKDNPLRQNAEEKKTSLLVLIPIIIMLAVGIVIFFVPQIFVKQAEERIETLKTELQTEKYSEIKRISSDLLAINSILVPKILIINTIDSQGFVVTDVLNTVGQAAPQDFYITNLQYNNDSLKIKGVTTERVAITEFISNMDRVSYFNAIDGFQSFNYDNKTDAYELDCTFKLEKLN